MTTPVLVAFVVIVVVAVAGLLSQVCYVSRTGGLAPSLVTPTEVDAAPLAVQPALPAPPALPQPRKASTPRGIRPPAKPELIPMMISEECSAGACALCDNTRNGCMHDCLHDPFIIVARNAAEYDRAHGKVVPA